MTSTDLVVRDHAPERVQLSTEQIQFLANTEFVDKRIRGNLPAIFATIATGRELGIGDMAALRHVFMVDGRPGYSAEIMVALVHRAGLGHQITGSTSADQATAKGRRGDTGAEIEVTWTIEDARRAGLVNKSNWKSFPQSMLWARAVSQLCRMLFADVAAGNSFYTTEELGEEHTDEGGGLPLDPAEEMPLPTIRGVEIIGEPEEVRIAEDADLPEALQGPPGEMKLITDAQAKNLNRLVGVLRKAERDPTGWIYSRFRRAAAGVPATENEDRLHWSALRPHLTRIEATDLIGKLEEFAAKLEGAA